QLVRPASAIEDEGRLSFYEWQELQGLREREKDHAAEIQRLQKRLEALAGPQHLKVENLKKELDLTDKLFVERNQHCRKVELEKANVAATLKSKEKEVKDLREELGVATEQAQAAQRCLAEKETENKALQRKCERLERSLKAHFLRNAWEGRPEESGTGNQETVVLESCGQQQSKIYRSQRASESLSELYLSLLQPCAPVL
ncbi:unnamed protein product, partial [Symbiodinium necroappetens]